MIPRSKLSKNILNGARRRAYSARAEPPHVGRPDAREDAPKAAPKAALPRLRETPAEQQVRNKSGRIVKAERDERVDITTSLTPVKTYMGGFTRPRDLRVSNWFPGGAYLNRNKVYEPPPPTAYEAHTVFIAETRYPVKHGIGRVDAVDHFLGVCREGDFPAVMARLNSTRSPRDAREAMDNARWPWAKQKVIRQVKWCAPGETKESVLQALLEEDERAVRAELGEAVEGEGAAAAGASSEAQADPESQTLIATEVIERHPNPKHPQHDQRRLIHFSMRRLAESPSSSGPSTSASQPSTTYRERRAIPTTSWDSPRRRRGEADPRLVDDVVPTFYVERKRQRDDVTERKEEEGSLMAELNAGILSDGLAAKTRAREEKIPVEVTDPIDGTVTHPSGFVPPTPETMFHPAVAKVATEDHPIVQTVKQLWDERPANPAAAATAAEIDAQVERDYTKKKMGREVDAAAVLTNHARTEQGPSGTFDVLATTARSTPTGRRAIPTSSWDSPRRLRGEVDPRLADNIVPTFYVERKRQRDAVEQRKEEEGSLMAELNAGILSDGLAAETKHREEKIPVEMRDPVDGTVQHASGFVPPTPETMFHPVAAKVATEDNPIMSTVKVPWVEVPSSKNGNNSRSFHHSAIARATAIPNDALQLLSHAFKKPQNAPQPVKAAMREEREYEEDEEAAEEEEADVNEEYDEDADLETTNVRAKYVPTLQETPFWRPLLTVTFSTRPLALTYLRLSRALPRGLPYHAAINNDDRKCVSSFPTRMRNLRLNRMHQLAIDTACLLNGHRGGFIGIRFDRAQRGRGIGGEGLADPIPMEKRRVSVGVGEWYRRADEVKEQFAEAAEEKDVAETVEVFGLDDWGQRTDGKSWPPPPPPIRRVRSVDDHAAKQDPPVSFADLTPQAIKRKRAEYAVEHMDEIALGMALQNSHVVVP
ncbi:hypothetical protein WOLCODRAFT_27403 [Wolfiporia cocos MD-104 SS10]|uniref:Uncharacterized protein n=1 Tax=Wolfiporia cocos (strain MD-104) TaxID=742152 RepID=A0A2H3JFC7_WOLCO|nr:hypothetical protein WOLCODRAFT_27403 [Wolfiporia cocos MD-104 SS10]